MTNICISECLNRATVTAGFQEQFTINKWFPPSFHKLKTDIMSQHEHLLRCNLHLIDKLINIQVCIKFHLK